MDVERHQEPRGAERLPDAVAGFRVLRRLATGGTSDVLLAQAKGAQGFERSVVLKLLLAEYKDDPSFERMFAMEAAAYARLSHPAIVKLYDFFATGDQLVMVLEYVDGLPLNALRAHLTNMGEVLDDRAVFYLMARVFAALAAAHAAKDPETGEHAPVIHRDVNPSNVLIHRDGSVKLADFGIAKVTGMSGDTKQGFIKGTFGYMAPEQVRGEQVTVRADVYAATLLLWELLARRRAIQHGALSDLEALRAMAHPTLVSLDVLRGDLPGTLRRIIARGLEASPDARAVTAEEMAKVLDDISSEAEGRSRLVAAVEKARSGDNPDLGETSPQPSVEESMALLAEADEQSAPPLPSYSVPAPPLSDMDMADTKLNTDARLPAGSIPDDVPTKPAKSSEIASIADDSLELPRFPMPSITDPPPPLTTMPATTIPDTTPDKDAALRNQLDHASSDPPPPSSRSRGAATGARLGAPVAPRPAIPRPASSAPSPPDAAPPSSKPKNLPRPATPPPSDLKPPSGGSDFKKRTMTGGFVAQPANPASPTPPPVVASAPPPVAPSLAHAKTLVSPAAPSGGPPPLPVSPMPPAVGDMSPAQMKTAPMPPLAIVPSALQGPPQPSAKESLSQTLAMPGAPGPMPPLQNAPSPFAPTVALPVVASDRPNAPTPGFLRNSMPTAPASFAPAGAPASKRGGGRGWIIAGAGAFLATGIVVAAVVYSSGKGDTTAAATPTPSSTATGTPSATPNATAMAVATATATATATPSATATAAASATAAPTASVSVPPGKAALTVGKSARQHRIYVDEKIVGEGPGTYFIGCGHRTVKVGSSGKPQEIDATCGQTTTLP